MKDDPVTVCPTCAGAVKRLLYPVGIVFKGTGWYVNDSRKPDTSDNPPAAPAESKDGDGKPANAAPADSKTEVKPESKTDAKAEAAPAAAGAK
jgi:hypothetical protein